MPGKNRYRQDELVRFDAIRQRMANSNKKETPGDNNGWRKGKPVNEDPGPTGGKIGTGTRRSHHSWIEGRGGSKQARLRNRLKEDTPKWEYNPKPVHGGLDGKPYKTPANASAKRIDYKNRVKLGANVARKAAIKKRLEERKKNRFNRAE